MKSKWFFARQEQIKKALESAGYEIQGYCNYQYHDADRYIECWNVNKEDKLTSVICATLKRNDAVIIYEYVTNR